MNLSDAEPVAGGEVSGLLRPVMARIDLDAVFHNAQLLARIARPSLLCAVVKANGYGHGSVEVARAALAGGARSLGVAMVEEGVELRRAGIRAPVLLLSEPQLATMEDVVRYSLTPTVYSEEAVVELERAARQRGSGTREDLGRIRLHVKVDTGMHRVGAVPTEAIEIAGRVWASRELCLEGFWTHLSAADLPDEGAHEVTRSQLRAFDEAVATLEMRDQRPQMLHAANSAALIGYPESRYDMVRCGIALYGYLPSTSLAEPLRAVSGQEQLVPAMSLETKVSHVRKVPAGERVSYGLSYRAPSDRVIATLPLGYADGVPRSFQAAGGEVLIGGERHPLAGVVTMDQLMVDCGPRSMVRRGDEAVLLGRQGSCEITADEWAGLLGTISYEVLSRIGGRVPRVATGGPYSSEALDASEGAVELGCADEEAQRTT